MISSNYNAPISKELLGNKGNNLCIMSRVLGLRVPDSIFIDSQTCRLIYQDGKVEDKILSAIKDTMNSLPSFKNNNIAVRSSGVVSMAGMMDTILNIVQNNDVAICKAIMDVVNSWDTDRAKQYRKICKISNDIMLAIVIQPLIRGDKGYSGICFSRDVNTGSTNYLTGEYVEKQLGDKLAHGTVTPKVIEKSFDNLPTNIVRTLVTACDKLEKHFKAIQDIEFVNDGSVTYIVQSRNAKLSPYASVKSLIDFYNDGIITQDEFKTRFNPQWMKDCTKIEVYDSQGFLFKGTGAVSGVVSGQVCLGASSVNRYANPILFANITTPDDLPIINQVKGLVTKIGGFTSHPAVICRELNKPCIIGVSSLDIDGNSRVVRWENNKSFLFLKEGDTITIIGDTGEAYFGEAKIKSENKFEKEVNKILNL